MKPPAITHERLLEVLSYAPETGVFRWLICLSCKIRKGDVAGTVDSNGYRKIQIEGRQIRAAILAWFYVHKTWPSEFVDHRNRIGDDNRLINLRLATRQQNSQNTLSHKNPHLQGSTPFRGRFRAKININGRKTCLGMFDTSAEAHQAYRAASLKYFGEFSPYFEHPDV